MTVCGHDPGGTDGKVVNFDLTSGEQVSSFRVAEDTVNGIHFHPYLPLSATASGQVTLSIRGDLCPPQLCMHFVSCSLMHWRHVKV